MARILDAAGALFIEKGVDGATMTEIASRSGTAIGSLYRFFPTKEGLSLTLLERFIHDRLSRLDEICVQARPGDCDAVADQLLGAWLDKREERDYTTLLLAARPDAEQSGQAWREQFLARVVTVLEKTCPEARETAAARGMVLLHVLKLAPQIVTGEGRDAVEAEIRKLVFLLVSAA